MIRRAIFIALVLILSAPVVLAQRGHEKDTTGEFFGEDIFLRPVKMVVGSYAPELTLARFSDTDCAEGTFGVSCFTIDNPDLEQTKTLTKASQIVIPGKTLKDGVIIEARNFSWMWYRCDAPMVDNGLFLYNPTVTIRSKALPAPIVANLGHRKVNALISPGVCGTGEDMQYSRTYRLTRSLLLLSGYTDAQIDDFFANDITLEMNIMMRVRNVDYADAYYDFMVYGY